jgi:hypothetical protein
MKKDKDIGFDISAFLEGAGEDNRLYPYQWQIENNGSFKIKQDDDLVKVFTPQLVLALVTREIATFDKEQNIDTIINGLDYLNSYVEGFKKGEQYFDAKFQVSADIRYGANAEDYVMDIHDNYFHRQHIAGFEGWGFVKSNFPITLTHKRVWEFGYFSGIVNKVEEQVKAHPRIFAKFEKCEHRLSTNQTEAEQEQQTVNDFTLSTIEDWLFEFREKMNEPDYQTLVSALKQYLDIGIFPVLSKPIQINGRINKKLFGWALNRIFEAKGKGIEMELLLFAKQNISLYKDVQFDALDIYKSNLYKYLTTRTE